MYTNNSYRIDGQSYGSGDITDRTFTEGTYGPDYFDLGPGSYTFSFYGSNVFNQPVAIFQAVSTIIEQ